MLLSRKNTGAWMAEFLVDGEKKPLEAKFYGTDKEDDDIHNKAEMDRDS